MPRSTSIIPKAPCARILVNSGAKRVSKDAAESFSDIIRVMAEKIAEHAADIARHAGRKTVTEGDIKLAAKV